MLKTLTCILCPIGCTLSVQLTDQDTNNKYEISGGKCPKGQAYALEEMTSPRRTLQSSIRVEGGHLPLVSVKTTLPVPKEKIMDLMAYINDLSFEAPIQIGDILVENILGLEASVVATKNIEKTNVNQNKI